MQPLATPSAAAANSLRPAATTTAVATTATTTRAQAQQPSLVMEEPKASKLLHRIVFNKQHFLVKRLRTILRNHIPLNQLGGSETSPARCSPFTGSSLHRHTTSLMSQLTTEDFSTDGEPVSGVQDRADIVENSEIEEWGREGAQPRSVQEVAEDTSSIPSHQRIEVLSPAALAEQRKKSPPTCKSHITHPTGQQPPPSPSTVQAISLSATFPYRLCGKYRHVVTDCAGKSHRTKSVRYGTNRQETGHYSILCTKPAKPQQPNNLNVIPCNFCFGHHHGSQCNEKKDSTSVKYYNRTKKAMRAFQNLSPMPEESNQPDLNVATWLHHTTTVNDNQSELGNEGSW